MKKIKDVIMCFYRILALTSILFVVWKVVRWWRDCDDGTCGHDITATIHAAADTLEKAATDLDECTHFKKDVL